jgi:hypothetical protein
MDIPILGGVMTINLNDCESMGINTRYSAEGIDEEYAYIGKKHCPFGTAFKLVRQRIQPYTYTPESGDAPKEFNVFTIKLWNDKTEDIPFNATFFYGE